jgi:hypothetical protein
MSMSISRRSMAAGVLTSAAILFNVVVADPAAAARPKNLNTSLDRLTDQGVFRISIQSQAQPIRLWRVHQWTVRVTDGQGEPVSGAQLAIDGGMPQHRHGLPTAPRAEPAAAPGDYVISGMKFSMPGWWELKLGVTAPDGRADRITFNVVL